MFLSSKLQINGVAMMDGVYEQDNGTGSGGAPTDPAYLKPRVVLRIEQAGASAADKSPTSEFQAWVTNADKLVSLLLKAGLLLIAFLATAIVVTACIAAMHGGIVVGHFVNANAAANEEKEVTPLLMNYLANAQTRRTNFVPLMPEEAESTKIKLQLGGADLPVDEVMSILQSTFSSAPHFDGTFYMQNKKWGANIRMNGIALPGGNDTRPNLQEAVELAAIRIIAVTQPILYSEMVDDNDIPQLQDALRLLNSLKSFYGSKLRDQALVAESNVLQKLGDLPGSVRLLRKAAANDHNALLATELALRAHFAGDVGLALKYATQANEAWDSDTKQLISQEGLNAKKAQNRDLIARYRGDFLKAKQAIIDFAGNDASTYDALDLTWDSVLHQLKVGAFAEADRQAHSLETSSPPTASDGPRMYVEGPAEYNMTLAIMRGDWSRALDNALLVDQIHLCQEPTKLYQRASVHKPWIDFLSTKAGRSSAVPQISLTQFNNEDTCYQCLRLHAHTLLHQASAVQGEAREALIRQALVLFDKAIDLAKLVPFAYFDRGLTRSLLKDEKDGAQQWQQDLKDAQRYGPSWGPVRAYIQSNRSTLVVDPADVFNWSVAAAGIATSSAKKSELNGAVYISEDKINQLIQQCNEGHRRSSSQAKGRTQSL